LKNLYVLPQNRGTFQQQDVDLFCGGTIMPYNKASINTKKKWAGLYIFSKYLSKEFNILCCPSLALIFKILTNI